jgi:hypothetical protein
MSDAASGPKDWLLVTVDQQLKLLAKWSVVATKSASSQVAPKMPPLPAGWKRWPRGKVVDPLATALAKTSLTTLQIGQCAPGLNGAGEPIAAFCEPHWDDHTTGFSGKYVWHKGISLLVKA